MITFEGFDDRTFYLTFQTEEDCLQYLSSMKWAENYKCRKCGHGKFMKGKKSHSRRCQKCKYDESATAHTLFHQLKFSLMIAFEMVFRLSCDKKGISTLGLSEKLSLSYQSCLNFRRKVQYAMRSSQRYPLKNYLEVDEFAVGGYDSESQGRAKGDKKLVNVALEITPDGGFGRAYAVKIEDYSSTELEKIFKQHIDPENTQIRTDKWTGYIPLTKKYNIEQEYSENGQNFRQLHLHIMNIKNWIRGTHHHVSKEYIERYLDEFHFRFNRRTYRKSIFKKIIERLVFSTKVTQSQLRVWAT
ncbi:IS1595 family transposase [Sediminitomix flava]|uniref:Transposase-like zinc ribbon protein n=1 Tax=Sediminitomix flava TaxID=379075 RepID=A0A315YK55_SEDFL|nr:IS1595 family transposase [Sediminitomix flava]PWJ28123.1 transposase-like zinc ribbon protein [Sediminitomix flava]